ncbi:MAG: hypothetical protein Q8R02_06600 [Hyphomonadaceae bacterium]|nr:hypothetical protein [Hyphomonadaceae bacterium]
MKHLIAVATLVLAAMSAHAQTPQKPAAECGVEPLGRYTKLTFDEFDQTLGGGWRVISKKDGCETAAADLIAGYREEMAQHQAKLEWHEAQVRAAGGDTAKAIELFRSNVAFEKSVREERRSQDGILYGEATIAFLENDRATLEAKRAQLAAIPKPDGFDEAVAKAYKDKFPNLKPPTWPLNLEVVDGLIRCFGKPYSEAYGCRTGNRGDAPGVQ